VASSILPSDRKCSRASLKVHWLWPFSVLLIVITVVICVVSTGGEKKMIKQEIAYKLRNLDFDRAEDFDALAEAISIRSREEVNLIVEFWLMNDENLSDKSATLLAYLGDVAIVPLLDAGLAPIATQRAQSIIMLGNAQINVRKRIATQLVKLFDDKEIIPETVTISPRIEGGHPVRRVCDEAYLQLRRLLNTMESEDVYLQNASIYLELSFEERDEEIANVRLSGLWARWMDESSEEE